MNKLSLHMEVLSKALFGKEPKDLNVKEAYNVVARALMMDVQPAWKIEKKGNKKRCGYLSAEFLVGRLIITEVGLEIRLV